MSLHARHEPAAPGQPRGKSRSRSCASVRRSGSRTRKARSSGCTGTASNQLPAPGDGMPGCAIRDTSPWRSADWSGIAGRYKARRVRIHRRVGSGSSAGGPARPGGAAGVCPASHHAPPPTAESGPESLHQQAARPWHRDPDLGRRPNPLRTPQHIAFGVDEQSGLHSRLRFFPADQVMVA